MTSIFSQLLTGIRGKATEAGQEIVDKNALTILDQQIRDAEAQQDKAEIALTNIMATRRIESGKLSDLNTKHTDLVAKIQQCIAAKNDDLTTKVAAAIKDIEGQIATQKTQVDGFDKSISTLQAQVIATKSKIKQMKDTVDGVKAQSAVVAAQKATAAASSGASSSLGSAAESLKRIQDNLTHTSAQIEASEQLERQTSGQDLDDQLAQAGIGANSTSVDDIIARYAAKPAAGAQA
jgi:phage shock protein A